MATDMQKMLEKDHSALVSFKAGESIKGTVLDVNDSRVLMELPSGMTGLITRREATGYGAEGEELEAGVTIEATVIDPENEEGLVMLSLRRASQDTAWAELNSIMEEERIIKVKIEEANKGGLMAKYKGLRAFLPVSQLMPMNYPRVEGADSGEILKKLQEHIGKEFVVRVLSVSRENSKIIISEKLAHQSQMGETLKNIEISDRVEGYVSGVVKFGIFVTFGGVEGLVHVSELEWGHVSDPGKNYSIGDKVEVLVIGQENEKLSFSIKQLTEDPWLGYVEKYTEGQAVAGKVTRWNDNGVFVEIDSEVQGLFSIDQFGVEKGSELSSMVKEGETISGTIVAINADSHRLELQKD